MYLCNPYIFTLSNGKVYRQACLRILNDKGEELSLAFDNSNGTMKTLGRVSMMRFKGDEILAEEVYRVSNEEFLQVLAAHLGFTVTKKEESHEG